MISRRGSIRLRIRFTVSRPSTTVWLARRVITNSVFKAQGGNSRTISLTCKLCVGRSFIFDLRKRSPSPLPSPQGGGEEGTVPGFFTPSVVAFLLGASFGGHYFE